MDKELHFMTLAKLEHSPFRDVQDFCNSVKRQMKKNAEEYCGEKQKTCKEDLTRLSLYRATLIGWVVSAYKLKAERKEEYLELCIPLLGEIQEHIQLLEEIILE